MVSVASGGTADRIAARILFKVLRAGSGTPARYSSTFFGAPLPFAAELRLPDFTFFTRATLQNSHFKSMPQTTVQPMGNGFQTCAETKKMGKTRKDAVKHLVKS